MSFLDSLIALGLGVVAFVVFMGTLLGGYKFQQWYDNPSNVAKRRKIRSYAAGFFVLIVVWVMGATLFVLIFPQ